MSPKKRTASPATGLAVQKPSRHQAADQTSVPALPAPVEIDTGTSAAFRATTAAHYRGAWGVLVEFRAEPDGQPWFRRSVFLTAAAAQRAVLAARARGQRAEAVLVELRPMAGGGDPPC